MGNGNVQKRGVRERKFFDERSLLVCKRLRQKIALTKKYEVFPHFPNSFQSKLAAEAPVLFYD